MKKLNDKQQCLHHMIEMIKLIKKMGSTEFNEAYVQPDVVWTVDVKMYVAQTEGK